MIVRRSLVACALVLAVALVAAPAAVAGPATDQLKAQVDEVVRLLQDPALKNRPAERHDAVRKAASGIFDLQETARQALGRYWQGRTPQEHEEFVRLFADLLDRAYISRVEQYHGEKIRYTGETDGGDEATVKTMIVTHQGSEVPVEYRMHRSADRWLVYDVVIEGVSLVSNYRTQFAHIIQTSSYQALLDRMRKAASRGA